jgi:predicted NAD-dependent protein-ADP-ribosyltransferase YbiA (DUF1768 family)
MRARLKNGMIILSAESAADRDELSSFVARAGGHVYLLHAHGDKGCALEDLGERTSACRQPINITSQVEEQWRPISNLALTPFELHGRTYASIEGFWQGLKFPKDSDRRRIAALHGGAAKSAAREIPEPAVIQYDGAAIAAGRPEHWALMRLACEAKFSQNLEARTALLATGERPLTHRVRRDSRTIPGVVMADIWMAARRGLRRRTSR